MEIAGHIYEFGRFRLEVARRTLFADGVPVALSSRAFDILQLLVELRDRVVTKDQILDRVWHGTIVEENNLSVQISGLRRALGEKTEGQPFIVTIPGRGYRFVGQVVEAGEGPPTEPTERPPTDALHDEAKPRRRSAVGTRWFVGAGAAVIVAVLVAGYMSRGSLNGPGAAPRLSIVVLPFRNLSDDTQQDYLADAVSDDLTTELSHLVGSFVIARQSSDVYKGRSVNAGQIGRELGVRYMLEGSVRRADEKLFINAQLIDTETGAHLWADRFDTPRAQLADAQSNIVQHIGSALNFKLVQIEGQRSVRDRPNDPDALDLFLRARSILDRDDSIDGLNAAQKLLENAIQLQPDFVDAMSELAWALLTKIRDFDIPTDAEDRAEARKLTIRALELAPDDARALSARGMLLTIEQGCEDALASYRLALSFDPHSIPALTGVARCADELGHPDEAAQLFREILRIDPQNPKNRVRYRQLGMALSMAGHPEDAIEWLQKAEAGDPQPLWSNEMALIAAYHITGKTEDARAKYAAYQRIWPHQTVWRLACYATKAQSALPGFKRMLAGLKAAGMPEFADEAQDDGVAPVTEQKRAGDFESIPMQVPGARTVTTSALSALLKTDPALVVLDVGCGGAVIPGAVWLHKSSFLTAEAQARLKTAVEARTHGILDQTIVAAGSGPYGWGSYNAALQLITLGYRSILWYRGGEEAWAAAGMPSQDDR